MNKLMLDHTAVNVRDIASSAAWYEKTIGAKIEYIDETWGMLDIDGAKIALTVKPQHPPHIAFRVSTLNDLGPDYREHRDGTCYIYKVDPDGNTIELIYRRNDDTNAT
jgi:catechol 2,3-dioxygenase-like lactoylglutathione lyase family enzyme